VRSDHAPTASIHNANTSPAAQPSNHTVRNGTPKKRLKPVMRRRASNPAPVRSIVTPDVKHTACELNRTYKRGGDIRGRSLIFRGAGTHIWPVHQIKNYGL